MGRRRVYLGIRYWVGLRLGGLRLRKHINVIAWYKCEKNKKVLD